MARAGFAERRDLGLLYIAQGLGEGKSANAIIGGLRERGYSYGSKQTLLGDIRAVKGSEKRPSPGAIKGGKVSGVMRSKAARKLSPGARKQLKEAAGVVVDTSVDTGKRRKTIVTSLPGKGLMVSEELRYEDIEDLPDDAEIPDDESLADGLSRDDAMAFFDAIDGLYESMGL